MNEMQIEIEKLINKFDIILLKLEEGTSHHSLVRNRIKALKIAIKLMEKDYNGEIGEIDLKQSLVVINSIISKSSKALDKLKESSTQAKALKNIVITMICAKKFYLEEIKKLTN